MQAERDIPGVSVHVFDFDLGTLIYHNIMKNIVNIT